MKASLQRFLLTLITVFRFPPNACVCPDICQCYTYNEPATRVSHTYVMHVVSCDGRGLRTFPKTIPPNVTHLSLSRNQIFFLDEDTLARLRKLEMLDLSSNRISEVNVHHFRKLPTLRELILTGNPIRKIREGTFDHLASLQILYLSETFLEAVPVFTVPSPVVHLHLDNTNMHVLTPESLKHYSNLEGLYLKRTKINRLVRGVFKRTQKLKYLLMEYSALDYIEEGAFDGLQLHTLNLQGTLIRSLPVSGLEELINLNLEDVYNLWQLPAAQLPCIRHLLLTYEFLCCPFVDNFFEDTWEVGRQEHGVLQECKYSTVVAPELPSLHPTRNPRTTENPKILPSTVDRSANAYLSSSSILSKPFSSPSKLPVTTEFSGFRSTLPTVPAKEFACSVHKIVSSGSPATLPTIPQKVTNRTEFPSNSTNRRNPASTSVKSPSKFWQKFLRTTRGTVEDDQVSLAFNGSFPVFTVDPYNLGALPAGNIEVSQIKRKRVLCRPQPDEFNPCEDLLGSVALRACAWFVSVSATTANLVALVVILLNRRKVSNHKLLMFTLSFSSLCMGVYLIILAAVDTWTKGFYKKPAKLWQHGVGCKIAGFLSVFSTEFSVFTLNIITLERYYTIIFPLRQTKWMTIRQTAILLVLSLLAALVLAALPLTGISSYTKVAMCLPFDVSSPVSKAYVTFLLACNGASFFAILFAYIKMYFSIQHTTRTTFVDRNIAKKMAVIVLTNFACWAPIAMFTLIAVYGEPTIDVPMSKFLLVFVFPINALTNPFLYFLVTRRFKQDLLTVFDRCSFCPCCAGSNYLRRERTSSFRTSLTKTTQRWRSQRSSGNGKISVSRRSPGRSSVDNQSSTRRDSVSRRPDDKRTGSVFQKTVDFSLPAELNARRRSEGAINLETARRKSYIAESNDMLGARRNIEDNMVLKFLVSNHSDDKQGYSEKRCETPLVCETAC